MLICWHNVGIKADIGSSYFSAAPNTKLWRMCLVVSNIFPALASIEAYYWVQFLSYGWKALPPMSVGRQGHGMAWAPDVGLILVVGGEEGFTGTVAEGLYRDWRNPQTTGAAEESWKPMTRMTVGTNVISMAYFKGTFIIAGGTVKGCWDTLVFGVKGLSQKEYEEGSRGAWFRLPRMPRPCIYEGLVATRNTLLLFGKHMKHVNTGLFRETE